ncbi:unnamed protein product [Prorocentrum cordatum]|uniref:Uncharacterized protein n=1 Tax=Prorocentrum cordatum TaxID=2364126 RepID=A0ABN9W0Z8_9DINO|nr:unnamed protein product [Polarella glacialis]
MVSNYAHFCSNLRHMHWYVVCAPTLLGGIAAILTFRWNLQARRAMPMSALLRSQTVFLLLGCGLSGGFQTLRPLSQGGCGVDDKYLVFGAVPMLAGARFPTIPEWSFRFASSLEAYLTGITVLSLLLVEPRLRQAFNPLWEKRVRSTWMEVVLSWSAGVFFTVGYPLWNLWFLASLPPVDQEESEGPSVRFANYEDKDWSYFFWTLGDIAGFLFGLVLALLARRRERDMLAYLTPPGRKPKSTELVGARVEVGTPPLPESSSTEASERSSSCFWSWCFCSCRRRTPLFPVFAAARNPVFIAFIGLRTFRLFGALYVVDVTTAEYLNGFAAQLICCIAMFRYADAARPLRDPVLWLSMQQQDAEQQDAQTEVNPASASDSCLVALLRDTWLHRIWSCLTSLLVDSMRMVVLFPVLTLLPSIHMDVQVFRQLLQRMGLKDITSDKTLLIELLSLVPKKEIEKGRRAWSDWQLMLSHKETSLAHGGRMDTTRCDVDVERPEKVPCPEGLPPGISGVLSLLTAIFRLLTGWLGLAIAMFGNNVLWNRKFSRVWYALVCVGSGLYLFVGPIDILLAIDTVGLPDATVIWPQPSWIEMFSYLGLFYWLFESAARVLFSPCGARNSATYRIETMARLYCRELLKGHESSGRSSWAADEYYEETIVPTLPEQSELVLKITRNKRLKSGRLEEVTRMVTGEELHGKYSDHGVELRPGQIHDVNFSGDSRPCLVREVFADGTCTLVTEAGKMLHGVLAKQLTPSKVTDRAIDKSSFSAVLRRAAGHLGSAVDRARFEVDKQTHKVRQSVHSKLRKGPPAAESQPEGGGWAGVPREGAQDELPRPGPSSASSRGIFDAGEEMDLDEESKRCLEKCRAGNNYQRSVDWSNVRRRKLRELFSTSVGYPVLVLAAIYGSALCVVMTSLSMAMKTTQLSRAVEVNRLKAVGALRITTGGLLCDSDEAAWAQTWRGGSYERCVSLNGDPAMCMTYGPLLFDAHDHDLNSELDDTEVLELVHMVHDVLLVRVAEDRSAVALLENEILDIAVQVKSSRVSAAAAWNGSANGTANSTVESIECADDDAAAVAGAAAAGFNVSGCQDLVTVCEDEAVGTDVHRMCPETCGACGSNGTESSSLELGCVDNNDAFRVAMAAQGYDISET